MLKMNKIVFIQSVCLYAICSIEIVLTLSCDDDNCVMRESTNRITRKERALLFPSSSTIGILAALALPLDDRKDVFLSYNFEANYNSPYLASDYLPGPLDRLQLLDNSRSFDSATNTSQYEKRNVGQKNIQLETKFESDQTIATTSESAPETTFESITEPTSSTQPASVPKARRSLVTRTNLYKSIEKKLNNAGYNGHDCLLRAICEAAEIPLGLHNGVLGDIMHIVFTPSSSAKENILYDFYDAEMHGTINMCKSYSKNCPESILDWISIFEER